MRRSNRECDREEKKTSNRGRWAKANETFGVSVGCVYENRTNNCFYSIACPPHDETKNEYQNKYDGSVCRDGPNGATAGGQTRLINGDNAIRSMKYQMSRPIVLLCVSVCVCVGGGSLGGCWGEGGGGCSGRDWLHAWCIGMNRSSQTDGNMEWRAEKDKNGKHWSYPLFAFNGKCGYNRKTCTIRISLTQSNNANHFVRLAIDALAPSGIHTHIQKSASAYELNSTLMCPLDIQHTTYINWK